MVHLGRIYTRTGDSGSTALGDGRRVPKTDSRIVAYGTVDELNAHLGACLDHVHAPSEREELLHLQNELFDLGADLCVPYAPAEPAGRLRLDDGAIIRLEERIDALNAHLRPLDSFVLPGGTPLASAYHLARTVCRRAERCVLALAEVEPGAVRAMNAVYLNRLSDLLFVRARLAAGEHERLWKPRRAEGR